MLYKVFLVEDEIVTREGIRDSVDWASAGLRWCGEASDGELALPMLEAEAPDILITDIKMPFMDGLELSRIVRARLPQTRIVILSGHDEFRYAQEAIQLGVTEYLLKPVSAQDLLDALARIRRQIEQAQQQQEELRHLQAQLQENATVLRQRFLLDLVTGALTASEAIDAARALQIDLIARCYLTLSVRCDVTVDMTHLARLESYHRVRQVVAALLAARNDVLLFTKDVDETGLLFKGDDPAAVQEAAHQLAEQIALVLTPEPSLALAIGLGRPVERMAAIPHSFLEACDVARTQIRKLAPSRGGITYPPRTLLALDPTAVITFLRRGELQNLESFLANHLSNTDSDAPELRLVIDFMATDVLVAVANFVQELGGAAGEVIPPRGELEPLLAAINCLDDLRAFLRHILTQALQYREQHTNRTHQIIEQAKQYIETHLASQELSLHTVAAAVGWSPSHFSTVFSRETGVTFVAYLTARRIDEAMHLLRTTTLSTGDIAYQVGYHNPRYFYAVFKRATGQSPSEYRQQGASSGS
ncbi:helix-turn-helix domain-containing protein [Caldilinea sp.]|uniref:response regulator n=1 Tax=Caldilinea sp. TaxID=2293560 RepID=UPI002B8FAAE7|nr:response regulator [Caldilinea sp.]HRA65288.1 response regulator [Caldilinea sp.]